MRAAREAALEDALAVLAPGERRALGALHEKLLAGLTSDRASARRMCRLCDIEACGHHRGTCPVTRPLGLLRLQPPEDRSHPLARRRSVSRSSAIVAAVS